MIWGLIPKPEFWMHAPYWLKSIPFPSKRRSAVEGILNKADAKNLP